MTESARPTVLPAGWYPDQADPGFYRWWDGEGWTDHRQRVQLQPPDVGDVSSESRGAPKADPVALIVPNVRRNAAATWSLILGILGLFGLIIPYAGLALGALAIVFSVVGLRAAALRGRGRGVAIAGVVIGGLVVLVGAILSVSLTLFLLSPERAGDAKAPAAAEGAKAPTADVTATTGASTEVPSPSDAAEEGAVDVAAFVLASGNDLDDLEKDLDDMIVTLDEAGFWRLLSNSAELTFNYVQLDSRTSPSSITEPWSSGLATLEERLTAIDEAIADERNDDMRVLIDETRSQVQELRDVLGMAGQ